MSHKFASLFLINKIDFGQINFIIIFQNIWLRLPNSPYLANSSNVFANQCSWTAFSHPRRLICVLIIWKISIGIKLIILNSMRINFIIDSIVLDSQTAHSQTISLRSQILTLVCLIVTAFRQIRRNVSERVKWWFYYFVISTPFIYVLKPSILRSVCVLIALLALWNSMRVAAMTF